MEAFRRLECLGPSSLIAFTVSLSSPSSSPVSANYGTGPNSADASDFTAASGTITCAPGEASRTIIIPTRDDAVHEGNETFVVNLSNPVGASIADGQGVATIQDNEQPPTKFYVVDDASTNRTYQFRHLATSVTRTGLEPVSRA